jgi:hypothetical protein
MFFNSKWVPAFAGMTIASAFAELTMDSRQKLLPPPPHLSRTLQMYGVARVPHFAQFDAR